MKNFAKVLSMILVATTLFNACQKSQPGIALTTSTKNKQWYKNENISVMDYSKDDSYDIEINIDESEQVIDGFGGSFNELGWEAMSVLSPERKKEIIEAIFSEKGCNFNICRMPIGANDFAVDWYSLNETPGDYEMKNFSIDRDKKRLIPYIKMAMEFQPDLHVWGSPWCPPSWMKKNGYYACKATEYNDLPKDLPHNENGDTDFITDEKTQKAYALYFTEYVKAYQEQGINVYAVHVQNEPHSCQPFPSCLWSGPDLKNFVRDYLGPKFHAEEMNTEIWYGTIERPYENQWINEIDELLEDQEAMKYLTGFGFQWAGKDAIPTIHKRQPYMKMMHTETECGDGQNTWERGQYTYELLRHYFDNGANSQMHWNMILSENQISPWGWEQNSMVTVNHKTKKITFNPEYYVFKHFSHFIKPNAKKLKISGERTSELAFQNPNGELVFVTHNNANDSGTLTIKINDKLVTVDLPKNSISTFTLSKF